MYLLRQATLLNGAELSCWRALGPNLSDIENEAVVLLGTSTMHEALASL